MSPDVDSQPEAHFCFKCGRRVDPKRPSCWYCGSTTRRTIRPPKKCPFCGSMIPSDAIKCRHCGEFVDGRKPEPAPPPTQIVYLVDHRLLQTTADRRLLPGEPVPREIAMRLSAPTLKAIEQNRPDLLDDPMVQALPAPESSRGGIGGKVVDIGSEVVARPGEELQIGGKPRSFLLPISSREVAKSGESDAVPARPAKPAAANLPSRVEDTPQRAARGIIGVLFSIFGALGRFLMRTAPGARTREDGGPVDVEAGGRYRICGQCETEILASDNYCYHCGMQYHQSKISLKHESTLSKRASNIGIYFWALLLCGGLYWTGSHGDMASEMTRLVMAGGAILLAAAGFFQKRTSASQFISIVIAVAAAGLWLFF